MRTSLVGADRGLMLLPQVPQVPLMSLPPPPPLPMPMPMPQPLLLVAVLWLALQICVACHREHDNRPKHSGGTVRVRRGLGRAAVELSRCTSIELPLL